MQDFPRLHIAPDPAEARPSEDDTSVAALMARMAAGDVHAAFAMAEHHRMRVAAAVRRQLRVCGVDHIGRDDLDGLVLDTCLALFEIAGAWHPGGAQPWWWAQGRILQVVRTWVGVHADSLDARRDGMQDRPDSEAASVLDEPVAETFERLVAEVPIVGLIAEACEAARVERGAMYCLLEYRIQKDQGDPSPAHTLAARYGISPDAMRQRVSRDTRRLRAVVAEDERFAELAGLVLVA